MCACERVTNECGQRENESDGLVQGGDIRKAFAENKAHMETTDCIILALIEVS